MFPPSTLKKILSLVFKGKGKAISLTPVYENQGGGSNGG